MKSVKPHITLLVLCCIGLACLGLRMIYPQNGIYIGSLKLKFPTWNETPDSSQIQKIVDVDQFLAQFDSTHQIIDTTGTDTSIHYIRKATVASLQFKDNHAASLYSFFEALDNAKLNNARVHIFHYGDSQIESDRMSNVLREKLQEKFGGTGSGLVAPVPITASANILQSQSDNWKRYTSYGFDDGKTNHTNFGVMCAYGRFTPAKKKEEIVLTDSTEAWIELRPSSMATQKCKTYEHAVLYFGNFSNAFLLKIFANDVLVSQEIIQPAEGTLSREWEFAATPKKLRFEFKGPESPDVYGIELHGGGAVNLSNIALRGNDGGAFRRVNGSSMSTVLNDLNAELIILQFGGNAVPYLKSEEGAKNYGKAFRTHIAYFKKLVPNASIIVVGPSDMSTSIDGVYQTWPYLESLKEGMKQAAFDEDCAFWDMYEVMGGRNSMISWVDNIPQYAGPDYTHFTPAGARKVAELFYKAIIDEYDAWKKASAVN